MNKKKYIPRELSMPEIRWLL